MKRIGLVVFATALVFVALAARSPSPLVVHEWGTVTTRHLPNGSPDGRLNRIGRSEELPAFVHQFEPPETRVDPEKQTVKSPVGPGRPDVTMRLETPVLYFYPPAGSTVAPFDVTVRFRGGVLNEFYPMGKAWVELDRDRIDSKIGPNGRWDGAVMNNLVVGGLRWTGVSLKETVSLPKTASNVWLAPRRVRATGVVTEGESERYLFYRGVAHLDAVVRTERSASAVVVRAPEHVEWMRGPSAAIDNMWFADIRSDGQVAFRQNKRIVMAKSAPSAELAKFASFSASDYSANGLTELRRSMKAGLMSAGLFDDEAEAMLETWKESYFRTPGLRVFYLVPSEWIAYYLPLQISVPNELTRVLVGRIDLPDR
ncbi:MAG TPA: hypothetical protein VK636_07760 [Gemmatimonadaceae bacterium]|nr:hypothetical protein [Gemmatimonadaceae bacterium]